MSELRIVLMTASSREEAERIARTLIEERLAACINLIGGVRSIYRWQEEVEAADEVLLIKTRTQLVDALSKRVHELHSYDTPEFVVLSAERESDAYRAWLLANLR